LRERRDNELDEESAYALGEEPTKNEEPTKDELDEEPINDLVSPMNNPPRMRLGDESVVGSILTMKELPNPHLGLSFQEETPNCQWRAFWTERSCSGQRKSRVFSDRQRKQFKNDFHKRLIKEFVNDKKGNSLTFLAITSS
jgi:hypothetical protein